VRARLHELAQGRDGARLGYGVRIRDEHELAARRRDPGVHVRRERPRTLASHHACAFGLTLHAARHVLDQHELVDLRTQKRNEPRDLVRVAVRDDDRRDRHASSSR
jgi:hypothetical protein